MKHLALAAILALLALPAQAGSCPVDMAAIDDALAAGPDLSEEDLAKVKTLRAEGEELHNSGDHAASVETLGEAKKLLGI